MTAEDAGHHLQPNARDWLALPPEAGTMITQHLALAAHLVVDFLLAESARLLSVVSLVATGVPTRVRRSGGTIGPTQEM